MTTTRAPQPRARAKGTPRKTVITFQGAVYVYGDFLAFRSAGLTDSWARLAASITYKGDK